VFLAGSRPFFRQECTSGPGSIFSSDRLRYKIPGVHDVIEADPGLQTQPAQQIEKVFGGYISGGALGERATAEPGYGAMED
jgi:hypothetical protein